MSKVLVNFIQDRSGSMQSVWAETLSGFKSFVKDLREKGGKDSVEYIFSLTTFDTLVETPVVARPIAEVDMDALTPHGPRGSTALYDAVGATIKNTEDNPQNADKIIVVIVTDGQENSSREWTKDRLQQAIEAKLNLGNWTFTYLGTQPETWDDASAVGISVGAVASYTPQMANEAYAATAGAVHNLSASMSMGSRSMMHDFMPRAVASRAGMRIRPSGPNPSALRPTPGKVMPGPASAKTSKNKKWR